MSAPETTGCAKCGQPRREHAYSGACYGKCGEFVEPQTTPREPQAAEQKEYHLGPRFALQQLGAGCLEAADYYEAHPGHLSVTTVVDLYRVMAKLTDLVTGVIDDERS